MPRMLAPIVSVKHYVQQSETTIAAGAIEEIVVIDAVTVAAGAPIPASVTEGSIVKAVFLELWIAGNGTAGARQQFTITIVKKPADATSMTVGDASTLASYLNKKNILYTTQGIIGTAVSGAAPLPILKMWLKLPKGKQRFGLGDELVINFLNTSASSISRCGFETYKEYQ